MQDLIGGQIDLSCLEASPTLPNVQAGRFKAYRGDERAALAEIAGHADHDRIRRAGIEHLVLARPVDHQGHAEGRRRSPRCRGQDALADPAVRARIEELGQVIFPADQQNPAALAAYQKAEIDKWWPIIKAAGIKAGD